MRRSRLKRGGKHLYHIRLKHADDPDSNFDLRQLAMGVKVEMEHTTSREVAKAIAKAHLAENSRYYTHLKRMEKGWSK